MILFLILAWLAVGVYGFNFTNYTIYDYHGLEHKISPMDIFVSIFASVFGPIVFLIGAPYISRWYKKKYVDKR